MKKYYFLLIFAFVFAGALIFTQAYSIEEGDLPPDVAFPVAELGDCESFEACGAYCDLSENMGVCLDFAEAHGLIPQEEIEIGRKILAAGQTTGPGGCQGMEACGEYCDDINHLSECLAFAEEHNLMPEEELEEMRKVALAIERGVEPPSCNSKAECDIYCSQPENMEECMIFAQAAGLIPEDELEEVQMVLQAIQAGATPPPCTSEEECDEYCSVPEHLEQCITFAVAAGFMSAEEAEMVRLTGGRGPGDCRGKEECEAFCENPDNMEECMNFAVKIGEMTPEEAEEARRGMEMMRRGGPGGCRSEEECAMYCEKPAHLKECIKFSVEMGYMSEEEAEAMLQMMEMQRMMEGQEMMGEEMVEEIIPPEETGEMMGEIIEQEIEKIEEMIPSCIAGTNRPCGTEIGVCQIGIQICENGFWGECIGGIEPVAEMCDGVDNDCDGRTDEDNVCAGGQSLFDQVKNFLANIIGV